MATAVNVADGRDTWDGVTDVIDLEQHRFRIEGLADQVEATAGPLLIEARAQMPLAQFRQGTIAIGLEDPHETVRVLRLEPSSYPSSVLEATTSLPLGNPLIETWEIFQVRNLYRSAALALADTWADLLVELRHHGRPWNVLAYATAPELGGRNLQFAVTHHLQQRGHPGNPRRRFNQSAMQPPAIPPPR